MADGTPCLPPQPCHALSLFIWLVFASAPGGVRGLSAVGLVCDGEAGKSVATLLKRSCSESCIVVSSWVCSFVDQTGIYSGKWLEKPG